MRPLATYLRSLDPMLPRQVWLVEAGGVVNSLGNGIVFPFIVIYLHNVRGISFAAAGLALSAGAPSSRLSVLGMLAQEEERSRPPVSASGEIRTRDVAERRAACTGASDQSEGPRPGEIDRGPSFPLGVGLKGAHRD